MPYLPPDFLNDTEFPRAYGPDVLMQIRMIEEQYDRFKPLLRYYCLRRDFDAPSDAPGGAFAPIGEPGHTGWDPLWSESIDRDIASAGAWSQPHGDAVDNAVQVELFDEPVLIHGNVRREVKDKELKKYGFDKMRDVIVTLPLSVLDRKGITVYTGDEFVWDDDRYLVMEHDRSGYWKNTNLAFFRVLNCEMKRVGS